MYIRFFCASLMTFVTKPFILANTLIKYKFSFCGLYQFSYLLLCGKVYKSLFCKFLLDTFIYIFYQDGPTGEAGRGSGC